MARRKKKKSRRQELLEELIAEAGPEALQDPEGLLKELTRSLVNTAMEAELSHHLGYEPGERPPPEAPNRRHSRACLIKQLNNLTLVDLLGHRAWRVGSPRSAALNRV
jgi:transposase-like protein